MNWTKEKPTQEGSYWLKTPNSSKPYVVLLERYPPVTGIVVQFPGSDEDKYLGDILGDYLWAGPLEAPPLPDEEDCVLSTQERTHLYNDGEGRSYDLGGEA